MPEDKVTNAAGLTIVDTLNLGKQSQEDSKYRQPTESAWSACGACRFFVRDPNDGPSTCQVVDGTIMWYGTCIYHIDASAAVYEGFLEAAEAFAAPVFMRATPIGKRIVQRDDQWCVVTDDGSQTLGCHDTREDALAQLRAVEANKTRRPAEVVKNADGTTSRYVPIVKVDDEERFIYGIVYEPDVEDAHGEFAKADTIKKSAHQFLAEFGEVNLMHTIPLAKRQVSIVESFIAPVSFEVNGDYIAKGSWVMAAIVHDDEIWGLIKSGELTGWSLEGFAEYGEEVERIEPEVA